MTLLKFVKLYAYNYHQANIQIIYNKLVYKYATASVLLNRCSA